MSWMMSAINNLSQIGNVKILGNPQERAGVISFVADGAHPYDMASMLDRAGIAVRFGNLCAQPMLQCLHESAAVRVSPAFYNTREEINYVSVCRQVLTFQLWRSRIYLFK